MACSSSSKPVQEAVGGYFRDPTGKSNKVGSDQNGTGQNIDLTKQNMNQLKEQLTAKEHSEHQRSREAAKKCSR